MDLTAPTPINYLAKQNTEIMKAFKMAAVQGHTESLKASLKLIPPSDRLQYLSVKDEQGATALLESLEALLEYISFTRRLRYLYVKDEWGWTALHTAAEQGHTERLKALLERIEPSERLQYLSVKDEWGRTALHTAAEQGHTESLKALLERIEPSERLQYLSVKDEWGSTALHTAAEQGHTESLKALLERIEPSERLQYLSEKDVLGRTALHNAAKRRHSESLKALLEHIEPSERLQYLSVKDEWGRTALHTAAEQGHTQSLKALLEHIPPSERLQYLCVKDEWGWTALHNAAERGHTDSLNSLLKYIPYTERLQYLSVKDRLGMTVLHCAAYVASSRCFKKLRPSYHAIIEVLKGLTLSDRFHCLSAQDQRGKTVLHILSANTTETDLLELKTVISLTGRFASQLMKITDKDSETVADVADPTTKKLLSDRLKTYNLHKPPVVLIFYMTNGRHGAPGEMAAIAMAFKSLGIEPIVYKDLTGHQVLSKITNARNETDLSALIVVNMSHGKEAYIEDGDCQPLAIQDMLLALGDDDGIPKVLVMQACRGSRRVLRSTISSPQGNMAVNSLTSSAIPVSGSTDADPTTPRVSDTFHIKARDLLVMCSTLHEELSTRNFFIPLLAQYIQRKDLLYKDLYSIAKKVNCEMRELNPHQVPEFLSTMDKSLRIGDFVAAK